MIQHTAIIGFLAVASLGVAAPVKVELKDSMGKPVGTATITEAKTGRGFDSSEGARAAGG